MPKNWASIAQPSGKQSRKGLQWYVVHWQCAFAWPKLPSFIQSALNTEARGMQSEVEIMLHMHEQMQDSLAHGKDPDWKAIQAAAGNSLPPCAPYISTLALYVQTNAGGVSGELLTELSLHQKNLCMQQKVALAVLWVASSCTSLPI